MTDRRSGIDRRQAERYRVTLDLEWENHAGMHTGTLSDISSTGCFILTAGDYADGERVFVHLPVSSDEILRIPGEITNNVFEIGFAVQFVEPDEATTERVNKFIEENCEVA